MITKEQLEALGFKPKECRVGTLWFNEPFFGRLKEDGAFDLREISDDMRSIISIDNSDELEKFISEYKVLIFAWEELLSKAKAQFKKEETELIERFNKKGRNKQ